MYTASAQNGSRIVMAITDFNYILTERDEVIVHWLLCMVFFHIFQSLMTMWLYPRGIS